MIPSKWVRESYETHFKILRLSLYLWSGSDGLFRFWEITDNILEIQVALWCNSKAFGLVISRSRFRILLEATLRNNLRAAVLGYSASATSYSPF